MPAAHWSSSHWVGSSGGGGGGSPPSTPALAIVDDEDGTGATATVSLADGGTTNTVYVCPIDSEFDTGAWVSAGSRSGNGVVNLNIDPGYYFGYVLSSNGDGTAASTPEFFVVTTGEDCVHFRILEAVVARLLVLNLDGIADANIVLRNRASDRFIGTGKDVEFPAIVVAIPQGSETTNVTSGTVFGDDTGYPVLVVILDSYPESLEPQSNHLKWREQIMRAFQNQRLPGVSEVMYGQDEPGVIVSPTDWPAGTFRSHVGLRFFARQTRGLT